MLKSRILAQLASGSHLTATEIAKALGPDVILARVGRSLRHLADEAKVSRTPIGGGKVAWQKTGHAHGHGCGCVLEVTAEERDASNAAALRKGVGA